MKSIRHLAIAAGIFCGTISHADVTAQQVWNNWTDQMAVYGQEFTTSGEELSGNTLTVSGLKIQMLDAEASIAAELGDIALTENGDGTVKITIGTSYPIKVDLTPQIGDPVTINITVLQSNMILKVSGVPDAMIYDISADSYGIHVDSIDGDQSVELVDVAITMLDLSGTFSVNEAALTRIAYFFNVGALDINAHLNETDQGGIVQANADIANLSMFTNIVVPMDVDLNAEMPPFGDGLAMEGGYSFGETAYSFNYDFVDDTGSGSASIEGGGLEFSFDMDQAEYKTETYGIDVNLSILNEIPIPLQASIAKYGFQVLVPLSQGEDGPRDARLAFNLTDLSISELLWNIIDPSSILPRDPVTVTFGVDAQVTPSFDFLDPTQKEAAMMSNIPGNVNGVQISELTVSGAGAEITGNGAFTFDYTDLITFDGFPRPEGQASFAINGINGLVEKLIKIGLIPADQAMMPRMMLGMFATPVGDDMLKSTIEFNAEGHVLANGQRLR
ncbi:MAG: DUF2125 domain-containing protein [Octadecabacter sp.]|nr:DUF2125 domain-containing protein [Octadecabacter sp.]